MQVRGDEETGEGLTGLMEDRVRVITALFNQRLAALVANVML
jgi:hypothetical protein